MMARLESLFYFDRGDHSANKLTRLGIVLLHKLAIFAQRVRQSRYYSLYISLSVSVSMCHCISLCICVCVSLYIFLYLCLCVAVYLSVSVSVCHCISLCICVCVSLYISLYLCLCVTVYLSVSVSVCHCISLCICVCVSLYISLNLCLCVTVYLSVSVSLMITCTLYRTQWLVVTLRHRHQVQSTQVKYLRVYRCFKPLTSQWTVKQTELHQPLLTQHQLLQTRDVPLELNDLHVSMTEMSTNAGSNWNVAYRHRDDILNTGLIVTVWCKLARKNLHVISNFVCKITCCVQLNSPIFLFCDFQGSGSTVT